MSGLSQAAAKVYAEALLMVGQEQNCLGEIFDDLHAIREAQGRDREVMHFFGSPEISQETKWKVLRATLEGKVCQPVLGLVHVLIYKGRGALFDNVVQQFDKFKDAHENRMHAYVTVASAMDDGYKADLVRRLSGESGKTVVLHEKVDPAVLGGAALRLGDKVIDRTLKTRLSALRKHLLDAAARRNND